MEHVLKHLNFVSKYYQLLYLEILDHLRFYKKLAEQISVVVKLIFQEKKCNNIFENKEMVFLQRKII